MPISRRNSHTTRGRARVRIRGELDHPDHQRDPDRIVEPRLSFEDRAGAAFHLLAGEHGERHGGIGWSDRCPDQECDRPVEPEHVMGGDGDERRGPERAEHSRGS